MRIDAHQHFWSLKDPWFSWPTPDLDAIYRDVGPSTLAPHLQRGRIDGTVLVQVAPDTAETADLLEIAERTDFVLGVVGWVDLEGETAIADLEGFAAHPEFRGIRPMIQAIPDTEWMLRHSLAPALREVERLGLSFDALVKPLHLAALATFIDRYPGLPVVIDHGAKPRIAAGRAGFDEWAPQIAALARRPHVFCKLSGLLTEAGSRSAAADLAPFVDHLLECFGPTRLMWGSDWPVVELAKPYEAWLDMTNAHLSRLSQDEQASIMGGVARNFYRL